MNPYTNPYLYGFIGISLFSGFTYLIWCFLVFCGAIK
jgi:hypothetical protein